MSAFGIGREEVRKGKKLEYVCILNAIDYEYDFHTTELTLKVISEFKSSMWKSLGGMIHLRLNAHNAIIWPHAFAQNGL
jgi:hypothetical protein